MFATCVAPIELSPNCDGSHNFLRLLHNKTSVKRITPLKTPTTYGAAFTKNLHTCAHSHTGSAQRRGRRKEGLHRDRHNPSRARTSHSHRVACHPTTQRRLWTTHPGGIRMTQSRFPDSSHFTCAHSSTSHQAPRHKKSPAPSSAGLSQCVNDARSLRNLSMYQLKISQRDMDSCRRSGHPMETKHHRR